MQTIPRKIMTIPDKFARKRPAPPQRDGEGNYEKQETQERAGKEPRMDMIGSRMPFPYDAVSLISCVSWFWNCFSWE